MYETVRHCNSHWPDRLRVGCGCKQKCKGSEIPSRGAGRAGGLRHALLEHRRAPSITVHHRPSPHRSSNINVSIARIGNHLARIFAHVRRTGARMLPAHRSDRRWAACCGGLPAAATATVTLCGSSGKVRVGILDTTRESLVERAVFLFSSLALTSATASVGRGILTHDVRRGRQARPGEQGAPLSTSLLV